MCFSKGIGFFSVKIINYIHNYSCKYKNKTHSEVHTVIKKSMMVIPLIQLYLLFKAFFSEEYNNLSVNKLLFTFEPLFEYD